ncbi:hypothetical protein LCGC14_2490650 [marine sediment metagenome]|uniref:TtsA-like Glycoside hydrolase family 108 domain-containing protein n=1 Tax=marine sediment metagenome TaxID=412755 RepID=A0A0F9B4X2_9ZZZZ
MIDEIITDVMKAEGWDSYTNDPADRGGPTKWGITQKKWSEHHGIEATEDDIKAITEVQARDFYEKKYVIAPRFNLLPYMIIPLVIDSGVNSGVRCASKWVQRAVGAKQDGWIGDKSIARAMESNHVSTFLRIVSYRCKLYGRLVARDAQLKAAQDAGFKLQARFASGWNNRVMSFLERLAQNIS